jgi:hypothetical protein
VVVRDSPIWFSGFLATFHVPANDVRLSDKGEIRILVIDSNVVVGATIQEQPTALHSSPRTQINTLLIHQDLHQLSCATEKQQRNLIQFFCRRQRPAGHRLHQFLRLS